jgi:endonuclease/exonuclease/phosphatase family metal-dependent hydrolase
MQAISWNLWHGLNGQGLLRFGELESPDRRRFRFEQQVETLEQAQADIICLQELNPVESMAQELAKALSMQVFWIKDNAGIKWGTKGIPTNLNSGLAILYREPWKLEKHKVLKLSGSPLAFHTRYMSVQLSECRYAQMGLFSHKTEGRIWVGNLHLHHGFQIPYQAELESFTKDLTDEESRELIHFLSKGEQRRSDEIDRVISFVRKLSTEPMMIAGDFNGDQFSVAYKKLLRFGFQDLWAVKRKDEKGFTWDAIRNRDNHRFLDGFVSDLHWNELKIPIEKRNLIQKEIEELQKAPKRIDYIFARSPLVPLEVSRMMLLGTESQASAILPSDHFGLLADWKWTLDEEKLPSNHQLS